MTAVSPTVSASDSPLRSFRSFMLFWWGRLAGTTAAQMLMVALGWQMYEITGSAWDLGLVGLLQFLPALVLTLPAGHIVDRHDRRWLLTLCLALQLVVGLALALGTAGGWVGRELILGLSLLLGVARAFQMPSQQALAPTLVPAAVLPRALAFSSGAMQAAVVAGPALGGFLYAAGATVVYGVCAALFALGCVLILRITPVARAAQREPASWSSMLAGLRFIWQRQAILGALSLDLFAVLLGGATALLPIFVRDVLHTGPWGLGLLRAAPAVGALLVSVWLTRAPIERGVGRKMLLAVGVYGMSMLVFGASTSFALSFMALFVSGGADMVSVVIRQTLVQLDTPDEMRGRVAAANSIFIGASNQLGEFESGATAAAFGPVGSVLLGGAGTLLVVGLWFRFFPALARRDRLQGPAQ
ncbi:MFS transporter [Azohydromonas caseinilytica]|uniref:MFS transporter n=1 Tax=Azohydromonas caseinilytica TaxID=2728836 RepID=A0A848F751_9BURK|nr:MFS transporter [Azohydromonas caseinilytica]NML14080.1 MFS transporter [Azohydromonas caseinilytica]